MRIKVRIISIVAAVTAAGGFLTALALSGSEEPVYSTPQDLTPPAPIAEEAAETVAGKTDGFLVGELDGYIAVWHNTDRAVPLEATGIAVRSLRVMDQEMLQAGVFFDDYMDVVMFLEDFGP
jgi:hypothetical protein